jgi:hypothetical protein
MWQYYNPWADEWRSQKVQLPTVRQQWQTVARIRDRAGDKKGAARARRSAALSGTVKMMGGTLFASRNQKDPLRNYQTHFRRNGMIPACGVWKARKLTGTPGVVDCGNCKRTLIWKENSKVTEEIE